MRKQLGRRKGRPSKTRKRSIDHKFADVAKTWAVVKTDAKNRVQRRLLPKGCALNGSKVKESDTEGRVKWWEVETVKESAEEKQQKGENCLHRCRTIINLSSTHLQPALQPVPLKEEPRTASRVCSVLQKQGYPKETLTKSSTS